ncbi:hypothetical protein [Burkholderia latens]|uniref:hypothetical protein n=1 Tax=Burkholderia latens TaxID=488446 RepID=UPI00158C8962|nr:hypothetical protein [Burkholderia latens]
MNRWLSRSGFPRDELVASAARASCDVHEGFPRRLAMSAVSTPRVPAQRFSAGLSARRADYLHFPNGAFAGCSIPDPHPRTYRSGVG